MNSLSDFLVSTDISSLLCCFSRLFLQLALSSDKISSLHTPLLSLSLDVRENGVLRPVTLEMNRDELGMLISSLESANKVKHIKCIRDTHYYNTTIYTFLRSAYGSIALCSIYLNICKYLGCEIISKVIVQTVNICTSIRSSISLTAWSNSVSHSSQGQIHPRHVVSLCSHSHLLPV